MPGLPSTSGPPVPSVAPAVWPIHRRVHPSPRRLEDRLYLGLDHTPVRLRAIPLRTADPRGLSIIEGAVQGRQDGRYCVTTDRGRVRRGSPVRAADSTNGGGGSMPKLFAQRARRAPHDNDVRPVL